MKRKAAPKQPDLSPRWVNVFPIPNGAVPVTYGRPWARRPPRDMVLKGVRPIYRLRVTPKAAAVQAAE